MPTNEELLTHIQYIKQSIDENKKTSEKILVQVYNTNGRVTTLETQMKALSELPEKVEQHGKDIATFKFLGPAVTSVLSGIVSFVVFLFTKNHQ